MNWLADSSCFISRNICLLFCGIYGIFTHIKQIGGNQTMDLYSAIQQRRTTRDFQEKEVPKEIIYKILDAGIKAPTNDHMRNWEFIVLTDQEEKARVISKIFKTCSKEEVIGFLDSCHMSDSIQREMYMDAVPKQYSMLYHSGCLVLPFFRQDYPLLEPKSINSLNGFASIWCCIENILLAATAEGLGCVTRIPFPDETTYLKEALGHPDNYVMPCYISIGYPLEHTVRYAQHEFDVKEKIHWNRW
jgi:nitroreductase